MSELINFRDFGGYPTKDGRRVKKNIFYRSGSYRDLTDKDITYLQSLGINHLFDYRQPKELDQKEAKELFAKNTHVTPASKHLENKSHEERDLPTLEKMEAMRGFYRLLPFNNPGYKEMMQHLITCPENAVPFLHNCTAGKDRTGIASAIILLALGVDTEIILLDYLKTMDAFGQIIENEKRRYNGDDLDGYLMNRMPEFIVTPSYLQAAFNEMLEKYGSYEKYLEEEFALDKDSLQEFRNRYTE